MRTSSTIAGHGHFSPGDLLARRYRIVAMLGKGCMGEVYRADDLTLLRRQWLAALAVTAIAGLPDAFSTGTTPWLAVPISMVIMGIFVAALVREGLSTLITALFAVGLVTNLPLSLELAVVQHARQGRAGLSGRVGGLCAEHCAAADSSGVRSSF